MAARQRLICASGDLAERGRGCCFEVEWAGERVPAFVIRFRGQVRAYLNRCAHVPVEMDWKPGEFFDLSGLYLICATHGALYAPESGHCLGGRCDGRGLTALPVVERDGNIYLIESE
jgi:nitrite reductase/ring-hydroxylating ferredoxin subunit